MTGIILNQYLIKRIKELNDKDIISSHRCLCIISIVCFLITSVYCSFTKRYTDIVLLIFQAWLGSIAYIDKISGYVYCITEYYAILPVTAALIRLCFISDDLFMLSGCLIADGIYIIVLKLLAKKGMFGEGDADIMSIMSIGILLIYSEYSPAVELYDMMIANIIYASIASFVFFIRNIRNISFRRMKLKTPRPFVPDLYIAYVIYYFTFLVK